MQQGDADSVWGILMDEVRRAVEWIDHPKHLFSIMAGQAFFSDEACLRQQLFQRSNNQPFRPFIHIRHIVVGMFPLHTLLGELTPFLPDIRSRLPCNPAHGQREKLQIPIHCLLLDQRGNPEDDDSTDDSCAKLPQNTSP